MNKYCECASTFTRTFTEAHNNLCPTCGKNLVARVNFNDDPPKFHSPEKRKNSHYQNNQSKPESLGVDNLSFTDCSSACHCLVKPSNGQFCVVCGGKEPLYSNFKQENQIYTNSFSDEPPHSSLNSPPIYIDPLNQHIYDNPRILRNNTQTPPNNIVELTDDDSSPENTDTENDTEEDSDTTNDDENIVNGGDQLLNDPQDLELNMEHFAQLYGLRPPRFESRKSDVRKFFQRYNHFLLQHPNWEDNQKVGYLSNLVDDEGLDFVDALPEDVRANYDNTQQAFIDHYAAIEPPSTQWSLITKRKQTPTETVTEYHDDLIRMAARIQVPAESLLLIFLEGLPKTTKLYIALHPNQPQNITQALTLAKTYQTVTGTPKSTQELLHKFKDEPSASPISNANTVFHTKLQSQIDKFSDKLDRIDANMLNTHPYSQNHNTLREPNPTIITGTNIPSIQNKRIPPENNQENYIPYSATILNTDNLYQINMQQQIDIISEKLDTLIQSSNHVEKYPQSHIQPFEYPHNQQTQHITQQRQPFPCDSPDPLNTPIYPTTPKPLMSIPTDNSWHHQTSSTFNSQHKQRQQWGPNHNIYYETPNDLQQPALQEDPNLTGQIFEKHNDHHNDTTQTKCDKEIPFCNWIRTEKNTSSYYNKQKRPARKNKPTNYYNKHIHKNVHSVNKFNPNSFANGAGTNYYFSNNFDENSSHGPDYRNSPTDQLKNTSCRFSKNKRTGHFHTNKHRNITNAKLQTNSACNNPRKCVINNDPQIKITRIGDQGNTLDATNQLNKETNTNLNNKAAKISNNVAVATMSNNFDTPDPNYESHNIEKDSDIHPETKHHNISQNQSNNIPKLIIGMRSAPHNSSENKSMSIKLYHRSKVLEEIKSYFQESKILSTVHNYIQTVREETSSQITNLRNSIHSLQNDIKIMHKELRKIHGPNKINEYKLDLSPHLIDHQFGQTNIRPNIKKIKDFDIPSEIIPVTFLERNESRHNKTIHPLADLLPVNENIKPCLAEREVELLLHSHATTGKFPVIKCNDPPFNDLSEINRTHFLPEAQIHNTKRPEIAVNPPDNFMLSSHSITSNSIGPLSISGHKILYPPKIDKYQLYQTKSLDYQKTTLC